MLEAGTEEAQARLAAEREKAASAEGLQAQLLQKEAEVEAAAVQAWQQAKREASDEIRTLRFEVRRQPAWRLQAPLAPPRPRPLAPCPSRARGGLPRTRAAAAGAL